MLKLGIRYNYHPLKFFSQQCSYTNTFRNLSSKGAPSYLMPNYGGQIPFNVTGASGPFLKGTQTDMFNNGDHALICFNAGYGSATIGYNPRWVSEITTNAYQTMQPMHVSRAYPFNALNDLAKQLSELADPVIGYASLGDVKFCPCLGGSDAVEAALKIALKHGYENGIPDGQQEIIFLKDPFHGRTRTVIGTGKDKSMHEGFSVKNDQFKECPINDIQTLHELFNKNTVAVIVEPVQGEPGIYEITPEFANALRESCNTNQALLIADEVQTGFYRTGAHCFASERINLQPDIIVVAKALGGMVPLAGVLARDTISNVFSAGTHGSTYAGNALSCQIALENLNQYEQLNLGKKMDDIGHKIQKVITSHNDHIPSMIDVRGPGAMLAIEMATKANADELVSTLFMAGRELGLTITPQMTESVNNMFNMSSLIGMPINGIGLKTTKGGRVLRITPPYLNDAQLDASLQMLDYALYKMRR